MRISGFVWSFRAVFISILITDNNNCTHFDSSIATQHRMQLVIITLGLHVAGSNLRESKAEAKKGDPEAALGMTSGLTLCFQGPYYWVLKGSRALTIRSLEA